MKAREMMQTHLITITPETSLAQAQRLMHSKGIRHLPVVADTQLVGMVTDRDIRDAAPSPATTLSKGEIHYQMDTTPIRTCMSHRVITTPPDADDVQVVLVLVQRQFGCMPVVENERLVGMITETDCLQAFVTAAEPQDSADNALTSRDKTKPRVKDSMQTTVITAVPENLVSAVFQQMRGQRVRHVPVVTEWNQLVGLISDRDVRRAGVSDEPHLAQYDLDHLLRKMTVNTIMTKHVYTVTGENTLAEASQLMLAHKISCLPVVRDDNILDGIVTVTNLLRAYAAQHEMRC